MAHRHHRRAHRTTIAAASITPPILQNISHSRIRKTITKQTKEKIWYKVIVRRLLSHNCLRSSAAIETKRTNINILDWNQCSKVRTIGTKTMRTKKPERPTCQPKEEKKSTKTYEIHTLKLETERNRQSLISFGSFYRRRPRALAHTTKLFLPTSSLVSKSGGWKKT